MSNISTTLNSTGDDVSTSETSLDENKSQEEESPQVTSSEPSPTTSQGSDSDADSSVEDHNRFVQISIDISNLLIHIVSREAKDEKEEKKLWKSIWNQAKFRYYNCNYSGSVSETD